MAESLDRKSGSEVYTIDLLSHLRVDSEVRSGKVSINSGSEVETDKIMFDAVEAGMKFDVRGRYNGMKERLEEWKKEFGTKSKECDELRVEICRFKAKYFKYKKMIRTMFGDMSLQKLYEWQADMIEAGKWREYWNGYRRLYMKRPEVRRKANERRRERRRRKKMDEEWKRIENMSIAELVRDADSKGL